MIFWKTIEYICITNIRVYNTHNKFLILWRRHRDSLHNARGLLKHYETSK